MARSQRSAMANATNQMLFALLLRMKYITLFTGKHKWIKMKTQLGELFLQCRKSLPYSHRRSEATIYTACNRAHRRTTCEQQRKALGSFLSWLGKVTYVIIALMVMVMATWSPVKLRAWEISNCIWMCARAVIRVRTIRTDIKLVASSKFVNK